MQRYTLRGRGSAGNIRPDKSGKWCKHSDHLLAIAELLDREFEAMKTWLGNQEVDMDLAVRAGLFDRATVVSICRSLADSPWLRKP